MSNVWEDIEADDYERVTNELGRYSISVKMNMDRYLLTDEDKKYKDKDYDNFIDIFENKHVQSS